MDSVNAKKDMTAALLKVSTKKKDAALSQGQELVGFLVKRNDSYQIIADGRARNITLAEYRNLMQYPDNQASISDTSLSK